MRIVSVRASRTLRDVLYDAAMIRMLGVVALVAAACSNNPSTGPASLTANGNTTAKSAWMEPTHAGYTINGMPVNYLGWLVRYTDATPGTECTDNLQAVTTIKIITTDVETPSHTQTALVAGQIPVATQLPDTGITTTIAVVSTTDATASFSNGMVTITTFTPKGTKGFIGNTEGEADGSLDVFGTGAGGAIEVKGDFYAGMCFL
jgi:hypothetical protein